MQNQLCQQFNTLSLLYYRAYNNYVTVSGGRRGEGIEWNVMCDVCMVLPLPVDRNVVSKPEGRTCVYVYVY